MTTNDEQGGWHRSTAHGTGQPFEWRLVGRTIEMRSLPDVQHWTGTDAVPFHIAIPNRQNKSLGIPS
jgi:hypothetical protein